MPLTFYMVFTAAAYAENSEFCEIRSLIVSTAIYASETWKSTARIRQQLDVFHQRNLRKILGMTWKDHVTNLEVLNRTWQRRLQDIVAERRLLMAGHIIRMPPGRPANHAMS